MGVKMAWEMGTETRMGNVNGDKMKRGVTMGIINRMKWKSKWK